MIYTVTLNPALDKTVQVPSLTVDGVNRVVWMRTDPGGKGINVSKVIQKLGGKSVATGILGGEGGRQIETALTEMGIASDFLYEKGETRTNLKVVDPIAHTNTDLNEPGFPVSEIVLDELLRRLLDRLHRNDIVVLSGSLPDGAPKDTYGIWTQACREAGAKVFLDTEGERLAAGLMASPYLVKPNHHELEGLLGRKLSSIQALKDAAEELMERCGLAKTVVSMGGDGALYVTKDGVFHAEGLSVPVGSTVGAGDSVVAALAVAEERGLSIEETIRLSTATGAANVMCSGTQAAEYEVIASLIPKVTIHAAGKDF